MTKTKIPKYTFLIALILPPIGLFFCLLFDGSSVFLYLYVTFVIIGVLAPLSGLILAFINGIKNQWENGLLLWFMLNLIIFGFNFGGSLLNFLYED